MGLGHIFREFRLFGKGFLVEGGGGPIEPVRLLAELGNEHLFLGIRRLHLAAADGGELVVQANHPVVRADQFGERRLAFVLGIEELLRPLR